MLAALERVAELTPDNPEPWAELGDMLFHYGYEMEVPDAHERSLRAYLTAVQIDSAYAAGLQHLAQLLAGQGDSGRVGWSSSQGKASCSP